LEEIFVIIPDLYAIDHGNVTILQTSICLQKNGNQSTNTPLIFCIIIKLLGFAADCPVKKEIFVHFTAICNV